MKVRFITRKRLLCAGLVALLLAAYPLFVLVYTLGHVCVSKLPGGRNGPLDAYRHALASAVVSYTLGDWAVGLATRTMEGKARLASGMDRHNNAIGAAIGARAASFSEIEPAVEKAVLGGAVNAPGPDQITWLPKTRWRKGRLW